MLRTGIIYCYTNTLNNKKYVGRTVNEKERGLVHKSDTKRGSECPFHRAIRKYGFANFNYEVLERVTSEELELSKILNEREIYYINKVDSFKNGYNATEGGGGHLGVRRDPESIKRGIETKKRNGNNIISEETKLKISLSNISRFTSLQVAQMDINNNTLCVFESCADVQRKLGFARQNIRKCCIFKSKTAYTFKWKYINLIND